MNKVEKQQIIDELNQAFQQSSGVVLFNFTGITVEQATELRRKILQAKSSYRVVKNTLAIRASADTAVEGIKEHFQGPTAIAYTGEDPIALAKVLTEFVKAHPATGFKGGVLDRAVLSPEQVRELAEMPSREELLSKLIFLLNAPLTRLASGLQAPLRNLGSVLKQLAEKKESE